MALGYMEEAYEATPGNESSNPTLSVKKLFSPFISSSAVPGTEHMSRDDENRNLDEPTAVITDAYNPTWESESRAYPDLLAFRLKEALGNPVTTAGNGIITDPDTIVIPTGAHRHVWTAPFGPAGANPVTTQKRLAYRDQGTYIRAKGCALEKLDIESPEQGGSMVKASGKLLAWSVTGTDFAPVHTVGLVVGVAWWWRDGRGLLALDRQPDRTVSLAHDTVEVSRRDGKGRGPDHVQRICPETSAQRDGSERVNQRDGVRCDGEVDQ
jgi:hypothetical protein